MSAVTNRTSRAFPSPYEVPPPDGCDGYREMYPYYLTFCEERRDLDERRFWLLDRMGFPEPVLPFQLVTAESTGAAAGPADSRTFEVPVRPAAERRVLNGFVYVSHAPAADPAEVDRRGLQLLPQVGGHLRRWKELYGEWAGKVERSMAWLRDLDAPGLPEFEDEAVVTEGRGITSE